MIDNISRGLGDLQLLNKIDELRELGLSALLPLPQIVVVGNQSSGKSSLLEGLTGIPFPRDTGLCTRFATEIISRRDDEKSLKLSIRAATDASHTHKEEVKKFSHQYGDSNISQLGDSFKEATRVMGIRDSTSNGSNQNTGIPAFSRDILKVEITGPDEEHFTVIDVPGIFYQPSLGLTTESDVELVKSMVQGYMEDNLTVNLLVIPCNVDISTQEILKFAARADPDGIRTLGVLTKPDLVTEKATRRDVVDLVLGKKMVLQLGYCLVRNLGADDKTDDPSLRNSQEDEFFNMKPWSTLPKSRVGISELRKRICNLLTERARGEFPNLKKTALQNMKETEQELESMGNSRGTSREQSMYLTNVAACFNRLRDIAINAAYYLDDVFEEREDLKLQTRLRRINEAFSLCVSESGHTRSFKPQPPGGVNTTEEQDVGQELKVTGRAQLYSSLNFGIPNEDGFDEVASILKPAFSAPVPMPCTEDDILSWIKTVHLTSQGPELGTFGFPALAIAFKEQSKNWAPMSEAHVSNAILLVHHFISEMLKFACADERVLHNLWAYLVDDLVQSYQRAINHTQFLLKVERDGRPTTYNPLFDQQLSSTREFKEIARAKRSEEAISEAVSNRQPITQGQLSGIYEKIYDKRSPLDRDCDSIREVLDSYYKVSRTRFVDSICQQAVDYFLLTDEKSPLRIFSPERVMAMTADELETIAGEDLVSREKRERLLSEIVTLKKALKIMKT